MLSGGRARSPQGTPFAPSAASSPNKDDGAESHLSCSEGNENHFQARWKRKKKLLLHWEEAKVVTQLYFEATIVEPDAL